MKKYEQKEMIERAEVTAGKINNILVEGEMSFVIGLPKGETGENVTEFALEDYSKQFHNSLRMNLSKIRKGNMDEIMDELDRGFKIKAEIVQDYESSNYAAVKFALEDSVLLEQLTDFGQNLEDYKSMSDEVRTIQLGDKTNSIIFKEKREKMDAISMAVVATIKNFEKHFTMQNMNVVVRTNETVQDQLRQKEGISNSNRAYVAMTNAQPGHRAP